MNNFYINTACEQIRPSNIIMASPYTKYYMIQAGFGQHNSVGNLYRQKEIYQRGYGIGSFFGKLLQYLKPLAMDGLEALSDQTYKMGKNMVHDLIGRRPLDDVLKDRGQEAILELTERGLNKIKQKMGKSQSGNGINKRGKRRKRNSSAVGGRRRRTTVKQIGGRRRRKTKNRKKRKRTLDIFT